MAVAEAVGRDVAVGAAADDDGAGDAAWLDPAVAGAGDGLVLPGTVAEAVAAGGVAAVTERSSIENRSGTAVVAADTDPRSPTVPATWRRAVASVVLYVHVVGSAYPSVQARILMVVGFAPVTSALMRMYRAFTRVRPATRTSVEMAASALPTSRAAWR